MKIIVKENLPKDMSSLRELAEKTLSKIIIEKLNTDEIDKLIEILKKGN